MYQHSSLHISSKTTYILWEGIGSDRISKAVCIFQARPLTSCEKENVVTGSARQCISQAKPLTSCEKAKVVTGSAKQCPYFKQDHLHTMRRNRQ
jgi:hypothetical protein